MKVLNKALIKESEKNAVNSGAFSFRELMQTAGTLAAKTISEKYGCENKRITVICGNGNNGGDGCVAALWLYEHGAKVKTVFPYGKPVTENAEYFYNKISHIETTDNFDNCDIIVDAMFGIGLNRELDDTAKSIINSANSSSAIRVAIDIPSGVESDSGKISGAAFLADLTVTFIALKPCFVLPCGFNYCGEVIVCDIGVKPVSYSFLTNEAPILPKRPRNSHKGTYGTALLFCGSYGMAGAAILSAKAALRSGVGIVKSVICKSIYPILSVAVPEAVCLPVNDSESGTLPSDIDIEKITENTNAVLFGCGVAQSPQTEKLLENIICNSKIPIVIDADGINLLSHRIELLEKSKAPIILTPHPKEMSRLCGFLVAEIEADRLNTASNFARKHNCILVLKGAYTVIAEPDGCVTVNTNGNSGMATAGSGDVLAGILVSLLSQGLSPSFCAKSAVYLHGEAGDKAAKRRNERSMIASDIIEEL